MVFISTYWMAVITGAACVSWIVYARSQIGRREAWVFPWLSLPFFALCLMYTWLSITGTRVNVDIMNTRFGIISIALPQAIILIILARIYGGEHGKRK